MRICDKATEHFEILSTISCFLSRSFMQTYQNNKEFETKNVDFQKSLITFYQSNMEISEEKFYCISEREITHVNEFQTLAWPFLGMK